jgi:hypothetical protein
MQTQVAHDLNVTATHVSLATERASFDFLERFDNNANGWWVGSIDTEYWSGSYGPDNGIFVWTVEQAKKGFVAWNESSHLPPAADFDAYVDVRRQAGSDSAQKLSYGLQFRQSPAGSGKSFYAFSISDDGSFRLQFHDGETSSWSELIGWTRSQAILADQWNTLGVSATGGHFVLRINDQVVDEFSDSRLDRGVISLYVGAASGETGTIWFDNLAVQLR